MGKIRPNRIVKGWANHLLGKDLGFNEIRYETCLACEHRNKLLDTCNICGCVLKAKTKVAEEVCPENLWHDIKEFQGRGLAVRVHDFEKMSIEASEDVIVIEYREPLILNSYVGTSEFKIDLINCRGDYEDFESKDIPLNNIFTKVCSCFSVKHLKNSLKEGENLTMTIKYNTKIPGIIDKRLKVHTDKDVFVIRIKGDVIEE
jgi:hypothetical protein